MDCDAYREAISAGMDGEVNDLEARAVDVHLARCAPCRTWAATAMAVTRAARLNVAEAVPDLTEPILMAAAGPRQRSAATFRGLSFLGLGILWFLARQVRAHPRRRWATGA
jgi:predicted anti-sigma-YlaC factor YlaD